MEKVKRRPNFTAEEVEIIVGFVEKHKKVLCDKFSGTVTNAARKQCFEDLAKEVTTVSGIRRSADEVKTKWTHMKSEAKSKTAARKRELKVTGGGRADASEVDENTHRIVNIVGQVCVDGISGGVDTADIYEPTTMESVDSSAAAQLTASSIHQMTTTTLTTTEDESSTTSTAELETIAMTTTSVAAVETTSSMDLTTIATQALTNTTSARRLTKRQAEEVLIDLQQQTLHAVNRLADIQQQLLDVKRAKLQTQHEELAVRKAELAVNGWREDKDGNWFKEVAVEQ